MAAPIIMAKLDTANYEFFVFGGSKTECLELLEERWKIHQNMTGAILDFDELADDVWFCGISTGAFERSELPEPPRVRKVRPRGYVHLVPIN